MDLKYYPDFWIFYKENQKEINQILNYYAYKYIRIIEPTEMFQELILRLAKSNVLKKYDSKKGTLLKTYFYSRVRGYAGHYAQEILKRPKIIPIESYIFYSEEEEKIDRHYDKSFFKNHVDFKAIQPFNESIDNTLYSMEIMDILKNKLNNTNYFIACLYFLDCYTCREITDTLNKYAYNTVLRKINEIKEITNNIIHNRNKHPVLS